MPSEEESRTALPFGFVQEADEDEDPELASFITDGDETELDAFGDEIDDEIDDFLAELEAEPGRPRRAEGAPLWVGFDAEWVYDEALNQNRILSIQLHVPPQPALSTDPDKQQRIQALSRLVLATSPAREDRPELRSALRHIVEHALEHGLMAQEPRLIYVVGFGLRFDLAALSDFGELKTEIDSVSGKVATVKSTAKLEFTNPLFSGDAMEALMIGLHFIDAAAHVPPGKALRDVGELIGLPKLRIEPPHSIERMDEYLRDDPDGYYAYAMRDAEIAVLYAMRLANFASQELGIHTLPATASGLALRWYLLTLKQHDIDRLQVFGLRKIVREVFHKPTRRRRTYKEEEPTPMRVIHDALTSAAYAGGRNESAWVGPTEGGPWFDYDLAGAYSTGMVDLPLIDWDHPRASTDVTDYLGHKAGYALIDFEHRADTRFPVFAISRGGKGLIFPLKGSGFATAPEIQAAHDLGCQITIRWGIVYPWLHREGDPLGPDDVPTTRLFGHFIKAARALRNKHKKALDKLNKEREAQGLPKTESVEEQAAKLYANSCYGKVCQSIRDRTVYDTRKQQSTRLKPSPITNPAVGAHVTGFIRAILAEILNRIPRHRKVLSCTTDGFITDATETELDACLDGTLCRRFQQLCEEIVPGSRMLEVKHAADQVICMKTRGQLTGKQHRVKDAKAGAKSTWKEMPIVLAKAGVQPVVDAPPSVSGEAYRVLQNEKMLNTYLDRRPRKKVLMRQFPSIRDQWENGIDLHKIARRVALSLEFDMKRQPVEPREVTVFGRNRVHLAMDTTPWRTVEEFDVARAAMDQWRRTNCMKTLADWRTLERSLVVGAIRRRQRAKGAATLNMRKDTDESDLLRRAFLRAYAHSAIGLTRSMSYAELAAWLTGIGYPTTQSQVVSARSQKLALQLVPPTEPAMRLWRLLAERFPDADLDQLLGET